jgi:hypothetical protein
MKTTAKLFILALTISLVSCSKSNDNNVTPSNTDKTQQVSGNWTVTYYLDSGKDETSDFSGYSFAFNTPDVLLASSGSNSFTGTWRIGDSSSDDDSSSNKLVIMISGNKAMDDLSHDWLIEKITATEIWLKDDNVSSNEAIHFGR